MKKVLLILVNCILLHSAIQLTQKPLLAAETTPSATPSAQVSELPTVRILPDNPLYFLKTVKEKVQLLVTRNTSDQANLLLGFAQKRLAEALGVAKKDKFHISEKLFEAFGKDIEAAQEKIKEARERGETTYNLLVELQKTIAYQKSVIEKLQGEIEDLNSFLIQVDQDLGEGEPRARSYTEATKSGKMSPVKKSLGLGILDWIRGLFGKKEILSPIVKQQ